MKIVMDADPDSQGENYKNLSDLEGELYPDAADAEQKQEVMALADELVKYQLAEPIADLQVQNRAGDGRHERSEHETVEPCGRAVGAYREFDQVSTWPGTDGEKRPRF